MNQGEMIKRRWCDWDSNPGPQDGTYEFTKLGMAVPNKNKFN